MVKQSQNQNAHQIFGVVGIVNLARGPYLITIKKRKEVGTLDGNKIWCVGKTEIHPIFTHENATTAQQRQDDAQYLALMNNILSLPLYFSYDFDITNTYQRRSSWPTGEREPVYKRVDTRFWWNRFLLTPFLSPAPGSSAPETYANFILPLMMGFVQIHHLTLRDKFIEFALISRRHTRRAGCRYVVRGIDASGAVANFVETEQIVVVPNRKIVSSFVTVRGSIPVFWTQLVTLKYAPRIAIQSNRPDQAFTQHFTELGQIYGQSGPFVCISLINLKGSELKLAEQYEGVVKRTNLPGLEYHAFDFHKECPGTNYSALGRLSERIQPSLSKIGWFQVDNANHSEGISFRPGSVTRVQSGTLRVNCVDNLDRTNVGQSVFARVVLMQQLQVLDIIPANTKFEDLPELKKSYQYTWADNANAISTQYAGTAALKVDFTRTGKRSVAGMLADGYNSLLRYFLNNFRDGYKQDSFNLFLGIYRVDPKAPSPFLADRARQHIITFFLILFAIFFGTGFTRFVTFSPYVAAGYWVAFLGVYAAGFALYGKKLVNIPVLTRPHKSD